MNIFLNEVHGCLQIELVSSCKETTVETIGIDMLILNAHQLLIAQYGTDGHETIKPETRRLKVKRHDRDVKIGLHVIMILVVHLFSRPVVIIHNVNL